jgi:collagenase-like PrtC family protease
MELMVQVQNGAGAIAALEAGAAGVAVRLPREPAPAWWSEAGAWQAAVRHRHRKFYLVWDRLVREAELPGALKMLEAVAQMTPDALVLRDLGLTREARLRFSQLPLHAAGNWGFQNSPGLRLADTLGFSGVVLEPPLGLKDLALLRRQSSMPLAAVLPPFCRGYAGLCLVAEHLEIECARCCRPLEQEAPAAVLMATLEMLSGLCQLEVEAVQVRADFFPGDSLKRALGLYQAVWEALPSERPRVLAAAREVLAAFGDKFMAGPVQPEGFAAKEPPPKTPWRGPSAPQPQPGLVLGRGLVWLEARGYVEAAALAREWRDPILLRLTPENYAAFLPEHRRWSPRRLIWRLPPAIQESALSFYQKALETLRQGGYRRWVAGDWGAVALARDAGGEVFGDQTLGVRNTLALEAARQLGVDRICLPPVRRPEDWRPWLNAVPQGRFWSYLYHFPDLAVCPRAAALPPGAPGLRWVADGDHSCLCKEAPEHLEKTAAWLPRQGVAPLVVALPRSGLPWGKAPALAASGPRRGRPRK